MASPSRESETAPINDVEQKVIDMLKENLGERLSGISENTIIRFVRGYAKEEKREEKTLEMMSKFLTWRVEADVDRLARTQLDGDEEFRSMWFAGIHGVGKDGHPVYIERPGQADSEKLWKRFSFEEFQNFHIQTMESLTNVKDQISRELGQRLYKQVVIMDLEGVGMSHMGSKFMDPIKKLIHLDQYFYPETLYVMIITNASWYFKAIWKICSPWIDVQTKARIKWGKHELVNFIDAENIPHFLGGKCKCEGGACLRKPFISGKSEEKKSKLEQFVEKATCGVQVEATKPSHEAEAKLATASGSDAASTSPVEQASTTTLPEQTPGAEPAQTSTTALPEQTPGGPEPAEQASTTALPEQTPE